MSEFKPKKGFKFTAAEIGYEPLNSKHIVESNLHFDRAERAEARLKEAEAVLRKIANEDFRGNRPQASVDAYRYFEKRGEKP